MKEKQIERVFLKFRGSSVEIKEKKEKKVRKVVNVISDVYSPQSLSKDGGAAETIQTSQQIPSEWNVHNPLFLNNNIYNLINYKVAPHPTWL